MPQRPPTFCVGCPERPVFSAMKLVAQDIGRPHVSMDVGCHAFASFEPFSQGNTLLGYGMSLASAAGVTPMSARRPWRSWATAASGTTACCRASPRT